MNKSEKLANVYRSMGESRRMKELSFCCGFNSSIFENSRVVFASRIDTDTVHVWFSYFFEFLFGKTGSFHGVYSFVVTVVLVVRFFCFLSCWKRLIFRSSKSINR